ncbi:MAG: hypothetical protein KC517_11860 [Bacteroidetes bacterium]|jgi:hypothetical protein|nr:hypothetical protein [Bacteroidota bacterium]
MKHLSILITLLLGIVSIGKSQNASLDTVGITNGSLHITGSCLYTKFLKKYKGSSKLTIHIWYNASGPMVKPKEIKAADNEIYFLYGRNRGTGLSEMGFVFGAAAEKAFSKKKDKELTELIDFLEFEVFANQNFAGYKAREVLDRVLE